MKRGARQIAGTAHKIAKTSALDADSADFATAMADVVPLVPDPRGHVRTIPHLSASRAATASSSTAPGSAPDHATHSGYVAAGVDHRQLRTLKRHQYPPDSRLDLHGMAVREALASLERFIESSRRRFRCVCVVHGRGLHSEGRIPILKTRVRVLLSQHRAVLAYTDAPPGDGGAGAVYVLLRK